MRKQSELEKNFYDEKFMSDAADMINLNLLEQAMNAQSEAPDETWMQQMEALTLQNISKVKRKQTVKHQFRRILSSAAMFVVTLCVLFSCVYFTVDAARDTINNFMLGKANRRASVVYPINVPGKTYSIIPENWHGPVYPNWLPDNYIQSSSGTQLDRYWWLCYHLESDISKTICIYVWDDTFAPNVDIEGYTLIEEPTIQNVHTQIYYDNKWDQTVLIMVKNDLVVRIAGEISDAEIITIAEFLEF